MTPLQSVECVQAWVELTALQLPMTQWAAVVTRVEPAGAWSVVGTRADHKVGGGVAGPATEGSTVAVDTGGVSVVGSRRDALSSSVTPLPPDINIGGTTMAL